MRSKRRAKVFMLPRTAEEKRLARREKWKRRSEDRAVRISEMLAPINENAGRDGAPDWTAEEA